MAERVDGDCASAPYVTREQLDDLIALCRDNRVRRLEWCGVVIELSDEPEPGEPVDLTSLMVEVDKPAKRVPSRYRHTGMRPPNLRSMRDGEAG